MNPILICNNLVKRYSYQQALGGKRPDHRFAGAERLGKNHAD